MSGHSTISPSKLEQIILCPGSLEAQRGLGDFSSAYAREGTFFHAVAASCLRTGTDAFFRIGTSERVEDERYTFTKTMAEHMQPALDWIAEQPGEMYVEQWVDLTRWFGTDPQTGARQGGTTDIGLIDRRPWYRDDLWEDPEGVITIVDWKYGAGVPVSPRWNVQVMAYALGFWWNIARHRTASRTFRLVVEQPRIEDGGGTWYCTLDDLLAFGREVVAAIDRAMERDAPRIPGLKQCRFCKRKESKRRCREYDAFNLDLVGGRMPDFDRRDAYNPPPAMGMSPERRAMILKHKPMIERFLEGLHADALEDGLMGRPTPGQKVIRGRRPGRDWVDDNTAESLLLAQLGPEDAFNHILKSPAQFEEFVGKKVFRDIVADYMQRTNRTIIRQGEGKPILVDEDAKGDPIPPAIDRLPDFRVPDDEED